MATAIASVRAAHAPILHIRVCVVAVLAASAAHVWMALGGHHPVWLRVAMLAMVAVCVPCALHIRRSFSVAALQKVAGAAVVMAVLHLLLVLALPSSSSGHPHGGTLGVQPAHSAGEPLLIIAIEISLALIASTLVARIRAAHRMQPALVRKDNVGKPSSLG